ncbi:MULTISPECIES: gliding motility-associated protein GldE [Mesonia]|uniref:gliding motility-associated protein GldE n=1 Tax=Mesonia TaxID=232115 RepID=UPI001752767E|nr:MULTISPECIES: gliding motility-associated protein GldE [Mesonia]HIB36649.1 gliding motility-associated protein GldE [Mesonia sp.]HIO27408.1 gliding motility-associated protein GldE [Flavobacteriaceae bacterium]
MDPDPSSLFNTFLVIDFSQVFGIVVLLLLLICSALISGSEVALFSLTPSDFDVKDGNVSAKQQILIRLLDRPKKLLATILVANNFVNIAVVLLFESLGDMFFGDIEAIYFGINLRFVIEVVLVTFLILLFGEILPKIYASRNKVVFSNFMAYPLSVLDKLLSIFSIPMRQVTVLIHNRLGKQRSALSVDQLSQALELTSEEDTTKEEQKILQGIVSFGNTETKQVMKPRIDMFALNIEQDFKEVIAEVTENGYSRIPVYEDNIDNVKGILYIKDLLPYLDQKKFNWQSLLREPYFVPENKKLDDLLNDFKDKKNHLAIVVDEYGGTSGLISLEDIIEEIVGDISDEFDDEDLIFSKLDDHNYVFEGKTPLKNFYKVIKLEDPVYFEEKKGEAETLAGFLLEISGEFPQKNQKIIFENYTFTIEAIEGKRIKQVKVNIGYEVSDS